MLNKVKKFFSTLQSNKSTSTIYSNNSSLFLRAFNNPIIRPTLTTYLSLVYYENTGIVSTAIDMLAKGFISLTPMLYNKETKEYITSHPILDLLETPNADQTKAEVFGAYSRFYDITGNSYLMCTCSMSGEVLELFYVSPISISVYSNPKDMFPAYYIYQSDSETIKFDREEGVDGFRYINRNNGTYRELWHTRDFNTRGLLGLSKLNSIVLEITQILNSNKHNNSLLENGVRSSGLLSLDPTLTQDQSMKAINTIKEQNSGSDNSGRMIIAPAGKIDFKEFSMSLKDMDFKDLKIEIKKDIALRLDIPLALIDTSGQSYNNLTEAKLSLYDNAILPNAKRFYKELSSFLCTKYKDLQGYELTFNILEIPAIKQREIKNLEVLKNMGILTINEMRQKIEYEDIEGGDVLYIPLNLVPAGSVVEQQQLSKKIEEEKNKIKYSYEENI